MHCLWADDLDDKVKQLRQLEQQLESAQTEVKQTENKKKQTQTELNRTANLKQRTDAELKKLSMSEAIIRDSVSAVNRRIETVNSNLSRLDAQTNSSLNHLIRLRNHKQLKAQAQAQKNILASLIENIDRNQDVLSGFKVMLVHDYEKKRSEFGKVTRHLRIEKTKSITYDKKIKNLRTQDQKLSQEQQKLQAQIAKLRSDAAALESLIVRLSAAAGKEPSSYQFSTRKIPWPLRGKVIRSFGEETRSYGTSVVSNGIDIAVPEGTAVKAVDDGEVVFSERYGGQGRLIIIDHKNGFFSVYAYNSELIVAKGNKVKKGQTIARSGMSGSASEPSLRFELRKDGKAVNPLNYLE